MMVSTDSAVKPCRRCRQVLPMDEYPRDTRFGMEYRRPTCKQCVAPRPKAFMRSEHKGAR